MSKITLQNLGSLQNENTALSVINNNSSTLTTAFDNTLSRDGTTPNQMGSNFDMNNFHILNLPEPSSDTDPVRKIDLTNVSTITNLIHTASSTSNTIGTGNKTFTVPSGLGFQVGQYVLIQQSGNTANFMTGRVVSYATTSLVVNVTATGGSGTISNWTIDVSGAPGATGPVATLYDTRATMVAATIPSSQTYTWPAGYTTVGDGSMPTMMRQVSVTTEKGSFQSLDGAYWRIINNVVTPEMFGAKGDGSTDDRQAFQDCIDFVNGRGGGWIYLTPNKNYRVVITAGVTDKGLIFKTGVCLRMNGSKISYECTDTVFGGRAMSHTRFIGPGWMANTVSATITGSNQSIYHSPLSVGPDGGGGGTVASPSVYEGMTDIIIDGITFTGVRNTAGSGTLVQIIGNQTYVTIRNCNFPDNSTSTVAIGADWGWLGTLSSANIALCKTNYLAGTAYTTHPNNLIIENNLIGNFSGSSTSGIRLSGVYSSIVRNNDIKQTSGDGIFMTGGDLGFEFALANIRQNACKNIVIADNNIRNYGGGFGIRWEAYPDNVYDAVTNPANPSYPYVSIYYADGYYTNGQIKGNKVTTSSITNNLSGILAGFTRGLKISENTVDGEFQGQYGIRIQKLCRNVVVDNNYVTLTTNAGIYVNDTNIENCYVTNNQVSRCSGSNASQGNIYVNTSTNCMVRGNYVGSFDEDQASNGIKIDSSAAYASVIDNFVWEVKTGGVAINIVNPSNITTIWECRDNRYVGSLGSAYSGLGIVPYRRDYSIGNPGKIITHAHAQRGLMTSDLTPSFGAWEVGSTITNIDAAVGQKKIVTCTVAGSPGTWGTVATVS